MAKKTKQKQKDKGSSLALIISIVAITITAIVALVLIVIALSRDTSAPVGEAEQEFDYTEEAFEDALNDGQDVIGKTVQFTVASVHPDSICGYNLWSGVHLNFCSSENIGASEGQQIIVRVKGVRNSLGSHIIDYELIKK